MSVANTKRESRREIAERLLDHLDALSLRTVKLAAIEEVLSERDERAAKIADAHTHYFTGRDINVDCDCGPWIAVAIRNGDTNA